MKFILASDECYYNHDQIVSLNRVTYSHSGSQYEVLYATFSGVSKQPARLFTSKVSDIPGGVDAYLKEHNLEMVECKLKG